MCRCQGDFRLWNAAGGLAEDVDLGGLRWWLVYLEF